MIAVAYHPIYVHDVPEGHKFPMAKYELLYRQILHEGIVDTSEILTPSMMSAEIAANVHDKSYISKLINQELTSKEQRLTGFQLSPKLIERELTIMQGTLDLAIHCWQEKTAGLNIAGGTHHAYRDRGEGFCLLNDFAIAAQYLLDHFPLKKVLIVDLDVHQGNGTAKIFENQEQVFTFSMHGRTNYPLHKENSDLDIALEPGTSGKTYLAELEKGLNQILNQIQPDFIFYQCGVDVLATDKLGYLALSHEDCRLRDQMVVEFAKSIHIPIVAAMGGGYSPDIRDIIKAHTQTFQCFATEF